MIDEDKLKELLKQCLVGVIATLTLPGTHNMSNIENLIDNVCDSIDRANLTVDTGV